MDSTKENRNSFFTHDREFYRQLFSLLVVVSLQNVIAYSVNMADNIMLGAYSQEALSGAAVVNQVFFIVQQATIAIGDSLVVLSSQYWGSGRTEPIRRIMKIVLFYTLIGSVALLLICFLFGRQILMIFTSDDMILEQGMAYLSLIKYTFCLFMITQVLLAALRSVQTVRIAFINSCVSLVLNIVINSTLIYGRFGFPEMGVRGAAVGTLVSRSVVLLMVIYFLRKRDEKIQFFKEKIFQKLDKNLSRDYRKVAGPILVGSLIWAISMPLQTAILGHLSADAIAANSIASTVYQYLKVIVVAMSSVSAVMMGKSIGGGEIDQIHADARTLSVIDLLLGAVLGLILYLTKDVLLSHYVLSQSAKNLAETLIVIMSIVMVGMSYQMPVSSGILRGSGDAKFTMYLNMISTWGIVIPLSLASAFLWKWSIPLVVICLQSDQIFKCVPVFLRFRSYKWIHKLTRE